MGLTNDEFINPSSLRIVAKFGQSKKFLNTVDLPLKEVAKAKITEIISSKKTRGGYLYISPNIITQKAAQYKNNG